MECVALASVYFSPNGDGYNDVLKIANVEKFPNFELFIYNRLGQQVHTQKMFIRLGMELIMAYQCQMEHIIMFFYDSSNKNYFVKLFTTILR